MFQDGTNAVGHLFERYLKSHGCQMHNAFRKGPNVATVFNKPTLNQQIFLSRIAYLRLPIIN